ncbi:MAG: DUF917 domain-containing protein [Anaerovoracaceae bacterium]|jgi:DUF917 family protein
MKKLTNQDIRDIIYGCTILGTGGGGTLQGGLDILKEDMEEGREFLLADLEEVPDEEYIAVPYVCGAISPLTEEEEEALPSMETTEAMRAFMAMEEYYGREFYGIVSTELGGENTADAFHIAAQLGKVIVDADPAGRSVPELQHSTFYVNGVPITPIAVATPFGDTAIINNVASDERAEALVRAMAVVSNNIIGVVDHPTTGEILKKSVIPGAVSYALEIGKALRLALEQGEDPVEEIIKIGKGKRLFKGKVKNYKWDTVDGFTVGEVNLEGEGQYAGDEYRVWFKNEHIASYLNGETHVTVPDLICMIDGEGNPVTNPYYTQGQELDVFALPAPMEWRTERGLSVFGPGAFGLDVTYRPICE